MAVVKKAKNERVKKPLASKVLLSQKSGQDFCLADKKNNSFKRENIFRADKKFVQEKKSWLAIFSFLKLKPASFLLAAYFIFVFGGLAWLYHSIQAEEGKIGMVGFYSSTALINGTSTEIESWQNKDRVLGEPEAGRFGDLESFTEDNSAIYEKGNQSLVVGDFVTLDYLSFGEALATSATTTMENATSSSVIEPGLVASSTAEILEDDDLLIGDDEPKEKDKIDPEKQMPPAALLPGIKNILALGKDFAFKTFIAYPAAAQWGADADDRNQFFGEFKEAKIKFSLAIKNKIPEIIPLGISTSSEDFIIPEENISTTTLVEENNENINQDNNPAEDDNSTAASSSDQAAEDVSTGTPLEEAIVNGGEENIEEDILIEESLSEEDAPATDNLPVEENLTAEDFSVQEAGEGEIESGSNEEPKEEKSFFRNILDIIIPSVSGAEDEKPLIAVLYSLNGGNWQEAGLLDFEAISNFANGDYFTLSAPFLNDWQDIDDLRLKLEVRGSELENFSIYLDGVWVEVDYKIAQDEELPPLKNKESGILRLENKEIVFNHTDENSDENLIIRAEDEFYYDLNSSDVYFSIENIGVRDENFDIRFYFPENLGQVEKLEKLNQRQPYFAEETELSPAIYRCDNGWEKREEIYFCYPSNEEKVCDSVSPNKRYCRIENAVYKKVKKIKYRDAWENIRLSGSFSVPQDNFFKQLLGISPINKEVPEELKPTNTSDEYGEAIAPGEVQYFRAKIVFPFASRGEFYIEAFGDKEGYGLLDPTWEASWDYERPVSITYSGSALTDYQTKIIFNSATLIGAGKMQSDCDDIRFANTSKGASLYYYLEPLTCNTASTTVWVKVPSISSNTTIYLYYGNSSATAGSDGVNTFSYFNDFETSVGFNEGDLNPTRTAGSARSGSYGIEADGSTNRRQYWRDGVLSGRDVILETWVREDSSSASSSLAGIVVGHTDGGANNLGYQAVIRTNDPYLELSKDYNSTPLCSAVGTTVLENQWYFLRLQWQSDDEIGAYLFNSPASSSPILYCTTTDSTYTNGEYGVADYQNADWDEYRVRKFAAVIPGTSLGAEVVIINHPPVNPFGLSQTKTSTSTAIVNGAWTDDSIVNLYASSSDKDGNIFRTYYELIASSSVFTTSISAPISFCDQNTAYNDCAGKIWSNATNTSNWLSGRYKYRIPITIQASQIKGALTNFPAYFDMALLGTANPFWSHTKKNSDGGDLAMTAANGISRVPLDITFISTSTKTGEIYFLASSTISSSSNITFYLYYGSSTASQPASTTTYGKQNVWSDYAAVWHLSETGLDGTVDQVKDSSANNNHGTSSPASPYTGAVSTSTGKIYKAFDFTGGDAMGGDYIDLSNSASLQLTDNFSFGGWTRAETSGVYMGIINKLSYNAGVTYKGWSLVKHSTNYYRAVYAMDDASLQTIESDSTYTDSNWHHVVASRVNGITWLYVDGVQQASSSNKTPVDSGKEASIGRQYIDYDQRYWDGVLDEMRVSEVGRSAKWIGTEYNNQNSPATFFSTSSEQYYLTVSNKHLKIPSMPESSIGYKWQALACDQNDDCSNWTSFNASIPNFKVDTIKPTVPGALIAIASTTSFIKLQFGATSTETNFDEYKIYYRIGSTTAPTEADTLFSSTSDANLASITFNGKSSTTISGLTIGTWYSFSIFVYDQSGQKASSSYIVQRTNRAPTGAFSSAALKRDGSGVVDISIVVSDADQDTELRAKIDYVKGSDCNFASPLDPTLDMDDAKATSTSGDAKIDNNEDYQIGSSTGWIITPSISNTINFDWLSKIDQANATGTYCLRLAVDDNRNGTSTLATTTVYIDNEAPTKPGALTAGVTAWSTVYLVLATATLATDDNAPAENAYKIFYKAGVSGVTENDSEQDSSVLNNYYYNNATSVLATDLATGTAYVFNIFAYDLYGNKASATSEMTVSTDTNLINKTFSFTNPEVAGAINNAVIADGSSEWNFRATVKNSQGWENIDTVVLRLANREDNSAPFNDLSFSWDQTSNVFSEVGTDIFSMVAISSNSTSSCLNFTCQLDFKIIFNDTFATSGVNYATQLYSTDDEAVTDEDTFLDVYKGLIIWINQIHYRWRNDDGGE